MNNYKISQTCFSFHFKNFNRCTKNHIKNNSPGYVKSMVTYFTHLLFTVFNLNKKHRSCFFPPVFLTRLYHLLVPRLFLTINLIYHIKPVPCQHFHQTANNIHQVFSLSVNFASAKLNTASAK